MTTMFGKGLRGRRKAGDADGETAQIADEANLWWTRRDFVQHAVVRTSRTGEPMTPTAPGQADPLRAPSRAAAARDAARETTRAASPPRTRGAAAPAGGRAGAPAEPAAAPPSLDAELEGRSFSEVFTTESLFQGTEVARQGPPAAARTPRPPSAVRRPAPAAPKAAPPPPAAEAAPAAEPATAPAAEPAKRRPRLPANHPLMGALELLGLDGDAAWADIQQSYRARAKEAHPDRTGDDGEAMAALNAAYTSLRDGRRYGIFGDD